MPAVQKVSQSVPDGPTALPGWVAAIGEPAPDAGAAAPFHAVLAHASSIHREGADEGKEPLAADPTSLAASVAAAAQAALTALAPAPAGALGIAPAADPPVDLVDAPAAAGPPGTGGRPPEEPPPGGARTTRSIAQTVDASPTAVGELKALREATRSVASDVEDAQGVAWRPAKPAAVAHLASSAPSASGASVSTVPDAARLAIDAASVRTPAADNIARTSADLLSVAADPADGSAGAPASAASSSPALAPDAPSAVSGALAGQPPYRISVPVPPTVEPSAPSTVLISPALRSSAPASALPSTQPLPVEGIGARQAASPPGVRELQPRASAGRTSEEPPPGDPRTTRSIAQTVDASPTAVGELKALPEARRSVASDVEDAQGVAWRPAKPAAVAHLASSAPSASGASVSTVPDAARLAIDAASVRTPAADATARTSADLLSVAADPVDGSAGASASAASAANPAPAPDAPSAVSGALAGQSPYRISVPVPPTGEPSAPSTVLISPALRSSAPASALPSTQPLPVDGIEARQAASPPDVRELQPRASAARPPEEPPPGGARTTRSIAQTVDASPTAVGELKALPEARRSVASDVEDAQGVAWRPAKAAATAHPASSAPSASGAPVSTVPDAARLAIDAASVRTPAADATARTSADLLQDTARTSADLLQDTARPMVGSAAAPASAASSASPAPAPDAPSVPFASAIREPSAQAGTLPGASSAPSAAVSPVGDHHAIASTQASADLAATAVVGSAAAAAGTAAGDGGEADAGAASGRRSGSRTARPVVRSASSGAGHVEPVAASVRHDAPTAHHPVTAARAESVTQPADRASERAQVIEQVSARIEAMALGRSSHEATVHLRPEHLGELRITVATDRHEVSARIITETPAAGQLLEAGRDQLRQSLEDRGLALGRLDVGLQGGMPGQPNAYDRPELHRNAWSAAMPARVLASTAEPEAPSVRPSRAFGRVDFHV